MHSIVTSIFGAILVFVLSPGLFVRLPKNGSKFMVAMVHALIFGVVFYLFHRQVWALFHNLEGAANPPVVKAKKQAATASGLNGGYKQVAPVAR
jgi:hypothetical protein